MIIDDRHYDIIIIGSGAGGGPIDEFGYRPPPPPYPQQVTI